MATRQQRRALLRDAMRIVAERGFSSNLGRWNVVAAARLLLDVLTGRSPQRASDTARRVVELYDRSLQNNPATPEPACRVGCTFCCRAPTVTATAPEVFLVAREVRQRHGADLPAVIERVRQTDKVTRGLDPAERLRVRQPCSMLVDGACTVYAARPLACRAFASFSREKCEGAFETGSADIPIPGINMTMRGNANQALWSALHHCGLSSKGYELNHALLIALEQPDAERRWLSGEDVFRDVATDTADETFGATAEVALYFQTVAAAALGREPPQNPWL